MRLRLIIAGCSSGIGEHLFNYYKGLDQYEVFGLSRTKEKKIDCVDSIAVHHAIREINPDILVNCVGQAAMNLMIFSNTSQYDKVITNNLKSTFLLNREAARCMIPKKWGRIINFGSCTQAMEIEGEALYTASKSGIYGLSRVFAKEVARCGITVNMVSPGPVSTRLIAGVDEDKIQKVVDQQIIKKRATFQDIRTVVDFLISREASMITGQNIYINGAG